MQSGSAADPPAKTQRGQWPSDIRVHALPNLVAGTGEQVPVGVEGCVNLRVPDVLLHRLCVRAGVNP
jgi:hypothetical protein